MSWKRPGDVRVLWALRVLAAAGLAVDAYVHFELAPAYDAVGGLVTQGMVFRVEAVAAVFVAILMLLVGRVAVYVAGVLVAGSAVAAVILYRWVDVGALGPLPNMYEPVWYQDKVISAVAEAVAALAAALLLAAALRAGRDRRARNRIGAGSS